MALLRESEDHKQFDTRQVEKRVSRGALSQKQVDTHLKSLEDDSSNAEWVNLEELKDRDPG